MKNTFLLFLCLAVYGFVQAQDISYGLKGGLNLSSVDGLSSPKVGFHVGGFVNFDLKSKFSIQPELLFSIDNGVYEYTGNFEGIVPYSYKQDVNTSSLNFPILINYSFTDKFALEFGPQLAYLFKANSKNSVTFPFVSGSLSSDVDMSNNSQTISSTIDGARDAIVVQHDYELNKLNFSLNIGTSYKLTEALFVQARLNLGLTNFTENANFLAGRDVVDNEIGDPTRIGETLKLSSFQISLGYKF
ncbi:MAG: PorT family protein [Flavobacterium sp.]|nr:PorT family protein [Flavobacterium sp.]